MYYYPDNIQESILIFQKGKFDYSYVRELSSRRREGSRIPLDKYNGDGWHLTVWNITNVLPLGQRLEKGIAAFPEEIPRRLIRLYSFQGETVLDPFLGSGTTMKVARELGRSSWGYEIDPRLEKVIKRKMATGDDHNSESISCSGRARESFEGQFVEELATEFALWHRHDRLIFAPAQLFQ